MFYDKKDYKESLVHRNNKIDVDFKTTLKPSQKVEQNKYYRIIIITSLLWILVYGLIIFYIIDGNTSKSQTNDNEIHDLYSFNKIFLEKIKNNRTFLFGKRDNDDEMELFLNLSKIANRIIKSNKEHKTSRNTRKMLNRNEFLHQQIEKLKKERKIKLKQKLELLRIHLNNRLSFNKNRKSNFYNKTHKFKSNWFVEGSAHSSTNPSK
jgi:hypothetical protein